MGRTQVEVLLRGPPSWKGMMKIAFPTSISMQKPFLWGFIVCFSLLHDEKREEPKVRDHGNVASIIKTFSRLIFPC